MIVQLQRLESTEASTRGAIVVGGKLVCLTLELPWKENRRGESCIPTGKYQCEWYRHPRWTRCPVANVYDVEGRTEIMIHPANQPNELLGCIAPGLGLQNPAGVSSSVAAMLALHEATGKRIFTLEIA